MTTNYQTNTFLYLGPSVADYRKALECDIWFKGAPGPEARKEIDKLIPYPLVLNSWSGDFLHCATDDLLSYRARGRYGNIFRRKMALFGGYNTLANPAGVVQFHKVFDANLTAINKIHPILFFLKPASDLYAQGDSKVKEGYSDWHKQSLAKIETEIVPALAQYFLNGQISREEKGSAVWIVDGLFQYIPKSISKEYAEKLAALLQITMGYDSYIDQYLGKKLNELQKLII